VGDCPTLTTERLLLRPFRESDLDAYQAAITSDEVVAGLASGVPTREEVWDQMARGRRRAPG
jgi:RimJ/RimL family protein N-acetyltransferase